MTRMHRLLCAVGAVTAVSLAQAESAWPDVAMPAGVNLVSVARNTTLNGVPMRIDMFTSRRPAAELLDFFRREWGARHVENVFRGATVMGRAQGEFYVTAQIKPVANGAQGIVAVSRMKTAAQGEGSNFRFPSGSRILSDMESEDIGKTSRHLVVANTYSPTVNREWLVDRMTEKGLSLERAGKPRETEGEALFFKGRSKEAIATIARTGGQTSVVLNITSQLTEAR